jgi:hypothetical protein
MQKKKVGLACAKDPDQARKNALAGHTPDAMVRRLERYFERALFEADHVDRIAELLDIYKAQRSSSSMDRRAHGGGQR